MKKFVRLFSSVVLLGLFILSGYAQSSEKSEIDRLRARLSDHPKDAQSFYRLGVLSNKNQQKEEALKNLEAATGLDPKNLKYGNEYRLLCIAYREHGRSVAFLERLLEQTDLPELHLQLALAYVDTIPSKGFGRFFEKAVLSKKSIQQLNGILEKDPNAWAALYARGMNYLYWPRLLNHTTDAIQDFKKLLALQESQQKTIRPHYVLPYIALGDAYVKNAQVEEARATWKKGLDLFKGNPQLEQRLALKEDEKLVTFVDAGRGLNAPIDTDLSVLWK